MPISESVSILVNLEKVATNNTCDDEKIYHIDVFTGVVLRDIRTATI